MKTTSFCPPPIQKLTRFCLTTSSSVLLYALLFLTLLPAAMNAMHRAECEVAFLPNNVCQITQPDIVIPNGANVNWTTDQNLLSNVVIQSGGKLTISAEIGLPQDARITVEPNGELYIDGGRLYNSCQGLRWEGIFVAGTPTIHQYKIWGVRYQGLLITDNDVVIEGARTAVRNYHHNNPSATTGGVIAVDKTVFLNNIRSAHFRPYQNYHPIVGVGLPQQDLSVFLNTKFIADADFGNDYTLFSNMVTLEGIHGVDFRACTFANDIPAGNFTYVHQKGLGIYAFNSSFEVTAICQTNPVISCTEYTPSSFRGFAIGVTASNTGIISPISVSYTNFTGNARGIVTQRVDNLYAAKNYISVGAELPELNNTPYTGIEALNCTGYKIEENILEIGTGLSGTAQTVGILIRESRDEPNEVYKNDFRGLYVANLSNGDNKGPTEQTGLQYICNTNKANYFDFAVPFQNTGQVGIAEFQGTPTKSAGNAFSAVSLFSDPEMHFFNYGEQVTYFWQDGTSKKPTRYTPNNVILPLFASIDNVCPSKLPGQPDRGRFTDEERGQEEQTFFVSTDEREKMQMASSLIRHYLTSEDSIQLGAARSLLAQKGTLYARFAIVDSWLQEKNAAAAQEALLALPGLIALSGSAQLEYNQFSAFKNLQIAAVQNGWNDEQLVSAHYAAIKNIADAGLYYASVQAQALLNHITDAGYRPEIIMPEASPSELWTPGSSVTPSASNEAPLTVQITPNPTTDHIVVHYRLPENSGQTTFVIRTLQGQVIRQYGLKDLAGTLFCNLTDIQPGIYLYGLEEAGKVLQTGKVVITR
ncbi:MAG: T9SS type A sorting domain-containing protein [Saprospiraceae bacterium]|nr:T9SS type A sorting domain-containing protein [Saprospiraceae bacterium]